MDFQLQVPRVSDIFFHFWGWSGTYSQLLVYDTYASGVFGTFLDVNICVRPRPLLVILVGIGIQMYF